jgi:hypothetical protein
MELYILSQYHLVYKNNGFPKVEDIIVISRENTGAGRYLGIKSNNAVICETRVLDADVIVKFSTSDTILGSKVWLKGNYLDHLDIYTFGSNGWDGDEEGWSA